ncbi:BREX-1 system phosphatase PglZ type A [Sporolactobacillus vineae]|uniref:BREX-1 system phosphatase PglZ type A n=1 Tax=Sporolactobacillus vineae TaxID=444463 RepID=UPI00028A2F31|nr:BREX-1 system phosphatase PglZ type A [Sporolactobacillus vineae]
MKLKEVQRVLNETFHKPLRWGQKRHLVFWYDPAGEFKEDIHDLQLDQVHIWELTPDNFFATKYELEKKDPESSFLIYAPMAKPAPQEDWLYDQLKMGVEFSTDKTTAIMRELGVSDDGLRKVFHRYMKFFNNKQRFAAFQAFGIQNYDPEKIDVAVLAVLTHNAINKLDEVVEVLMRETAAGGNRSWEMIGKFGDIDAFWHLVEKAYGYTRGEKSLPDLITFFMLTYLVSTAPDLNLPEDWKAYLAVRPMNVVVLMSQFMNQPQDRAAFQKLSGMVAKTIHLESHLKAWEVQNYLKADAFKEFDQSLIQYIITQLTSGVGQFDTYQSMLDARRTLHWYPDYVDAYEAVGQAICLFQLDAEQQHFIPESSAGQMFQKYTDDYYRFDQAYRKFYMTYDRWQQDDSLIPLRRQVEHAYTSGYLRELSAKWTQSLNRRAPDQWAITGVPQQTRFYTECVQPYVTRGERVFVIISDAFRYEAGQELTDRLNQEKKGLAELSAMQSTLPSYTALGMPALLPHHSLSYQGNSQKEPEILLDQMTTIGTYARNLILQKRVKESLAIQAQDLRDMRQQEMRQKFQSLKVVYIYHNRIDASGDHPASETEVFAATEQAIDELIALVNKLVNNVSASAVIVTADHGYLYQRDPVKPSGKLPKADGMVLALNRRFMLSEEKTDAEGTLQFSTEGELANDPPLMITIPNGDERFMVQGGGANYVHGGAMLQEIAVPVVAFRSRRNDVLRQVNVKLMSSTRKITNIITFLEFYQTEPMAEKVHPRRLNLFFTDSDKEKMSNEVHLLADRSSEKPADRVFREKFVFKNRSYDRHATYYLVLEDEDQTVEKIYERIPFTIDIAFADDFGF